MEDIKPASYFVELQAMASRYPFVLESLEFAPDIAKWSSAHGVAEQKPFLPGTTVQNPTTGGYSICLRSWITQDIIRSVTGRLAALGFDVDELETDPRQFVRHLLLHEIAHALDKTRTEKECDQWAFEQLEMLGASPGVRRFFGDFLKRSSRLLGRWFHRK